VDKGKDMVGRVIISQKIASTAPKAGKPKPNQVSTAVEFLVPRARGQIPIGNGRPFLPGGGVSVGSLL